MAIDATPEPAARPPAAPRHRGLLPVSIRARLTLWYAAALAAFLCGAALASYALLARSSLQRIDQSLLETARAFSAAWVAQRAATLDATAFPSDVVARFTVGELAVAVFDEGERMIAARPSMPDWAGGSPSRRDLLALLHQLTTANVARGTLPGADAPRRAVAIPLRVGGRRQLVVVAQGLGSRAIMLRDARDAYLVAVPMALALALVGGYLLAGRALAPVAALADQADRIGATTLHQRLEVPNARDEIGRLAAVFNGTLARLDRAFDQQRQFMADAAHELRTPVAVVRTEADVALDAEDRPPAAYREALTVIRDEGRRISRIIDDLFLLARADAGQYQVRPTDGYLDDLLDDCVRAVRTLAAARGVSVQFDAPSEEMPFRGDEALLRRLVMNLLDNAIKYGPDGGTVTLRAWREGAARDDPPPRYVVTVHNAGGPIPPDVRHRLFDRFYRGTHEPAAETSASGAGLGLPIARWIAESHAGTLELARSDASGTEFRLVLPAPATDASRPG
jgi:signal transduction histidine kinase